jgi:hypothetical protein
MFAILELQLTKFNQGDVIPGVLLVKERYVSGVVLRILIKLKNALMVEHHHQVLIVFLVVLHTHAMLELLPNHKILDVLSVHHSLVSKNQVFVCSRCFNRLVNPGEPILVLGHCRLVMTSLRKFFTSDTDNWISAKL